MPGVFQGGQRGVDPGRSPVGNGQAGGRDDGADPADAALKIKALKDSGKKSALLLVSNGQGEVRYVALEVD